MGYLSRKVLHGAPVLALLTIGHSPVAAPSECLSSDPAEAALSWEHCTPDQRLSVALGMVMHDWLYNHYAPISLDSELLKLGFDDAAAGERIPIDKAEARSILRGTRPPAGEGERYAWKLHRLLNCTDARHSVIMRALAGDGGTRRDEADADAEASADACLAPVDLDGCEAAVPPCFDASATVTLSYRLDAIGEQMHSKLAKHPTTSPLPRPDGEKTGQAFVVGKTIKGWQTVLRHMKPTLDYEVVVPPSQGYGERGVEGSVKPGEYLRFVMRLECEGLDTEKYPVCS